MTDETPNETKPDLQESLNNTFTKTEYETIRRWIEHQNTNQVGVLANLLVNGDPFDEIISKYDNCYEMIVNLINTCGYEVKELSFTETLSYENDLEMLVPANQTYEDIYDEWISSRCVEDILDSGRTDLDHDNVVIGDKVLFRLHPQES
jgi:hypothetical protein